MLLHLILGCIDFWLTLILNISVRAVAAANDVLVVNASTSIPRFRSFIKQKILFLKKENSQFAGAVKL